MTATLEGDVLSATKYLFSLPLGGDVFSVHAGVGEGGQHQQ